LSKLKAEIEKETTRQQKDLEALLLNGPAFSKKQSDTIYKTQKVESY